MGFEIKIGRFRLRFLEIFTLVMLTIIYILAATVKEGSALYESLEQMSGDWEAIATTTTTVLWTAFLFSAFANSTVMIAVPYYLIVFELAKYYPNWVLLAIVAGLGAAIGEVASYLIGRGLSETHAIKDSELSEKFMRMKNNFERHPTRVPFWVFLFALTPLPDDMILVPMGIMKYPYWKSVIPCFLGKTGLMLILSYLGMLIGKNADFLELVAITPGYEWLAGPINLILPTNRISPASDLIQFSLVFIVIYFVFRMDFDKQLLKRSKIRKDFQKKLIEGGNYSLIELTHKYKIEDHDVFENFIQTFVDTHDNVQLKDDLLHFEEILDKNIAFTQSMEFAHYYYGDTNNNETPVKQE